VAGARTATPEVAPDIEIAEAPATEAAPEGIAPHQDAVPDMVAEVQMPEPERADPAPEAMAALPPAPGIPENTGAETGQDAPLIIIADDPVPEAAPVTLPADSPVAPVAPQPGFDKPVAGVQVGRLPRIGGDAAPVAPVTEQITAPADTPALPPVEAYAAAFENPAAKPVFSVLLLDTGGPELDRVALASLPFPVTFVIDPSQPDAAVAAAIYRAVGKEVVMLATGLPAGATAADIAVTFEAYSQVLPEAVAVLDLENGGYQGNRALANEVLTVIGDQGRGVLSWDKGLNAASQIARREGLYNATIYRNLDANDERATTIRRFLDRAAFKAAQDGRVVVLGRTRDETIAALLEWAVEGRASSVAVGPVTAVMTRQ
jgi:polysaccharide deacetylase 2 family uncharacterized protein YibQ